MAKFCQECGAKLIHDNIKYCPECGSKILYVDSEKVAPTIIDDKKIEANEQTVVEKRGKFTNFFNFILLLFGGLVIASLYLFPVAKVEEVSMTVADIHSYCSNTLIRVIGGDACSQFDTIFIIGWIIGIITIGFALALIIVDEIKNG